MSFPPAANAALINWSDAMSILVLLLIICSMVGSSISPFRPSLQSKNKSPFLGWIALPQTVGSIFSFVPRAFRIWFFLGWLSASSSEITPWSTNSCT